MAAVGVLALGRPERLGRAILSGWSARAAAPASAAAAMGGGLVYVLWPYAGLETAGLAEVLARLGLGGTSWWVFGAYFVGVHPLLEELTWRCYLARAQRGPHWIDALFAGYHVPVLILFLKPPWILPGFAVLALAAWGWRIIARWTGGLGVAVISHAAANASIFLVATVIAA